MLIGVFVKAKTFVVSTVIFASLVLTWVLSEPIESPITSDENKAAAYSVTVLNVTPSTINNAVKATGISKVRWELNVISPVSGKIKVLPSELEPGVKLTQSALLASIVDTSFQSELVVAKARVAQAELNLARYQHEQYVAKHVNGQRKANAYGNFEPHIKSAKAELAATKVQLKYAQERLADTLIVAPYNAMVLEKYITPSQWVSEGDVIFKIAATDSIDINVELSDFAWQRIGKIDANSTINVETPNGKVWPATVRYINPMLNKQTRQRSVVLHVSAPFSGDSPLMPEQQVNVAFKGTIQKNTITAPSTVLTHDHKVWTVHDGELMMESVELIEEQSDLVSFRFLTAANAPRTLVLFPLSSMLVGQKVTVNPTTLESI